MKLKFRYTQDNGTKLAIEALRENYIIAIGEDGNYNSVIIPKRMLIDVLLTIAQEAMNGNTESV